MKRFHETNFIDVEEEEELILSTIEKFPQLSEELKQTPPTVTAREKSGGRCISNTTKNNINWSGTTSDSNIKNHVKIIKIQEPVTAGKYPLKKENEKEIKPKKYRRIKPVKLPLSILVIDKKVIDPSVFTGDIIKIVYKNPEGFDPSHLMGCSSLQILNLNGALSYFRTNADQRFALASLNLSIQNSGCVLRELNLSQNAVGQAILEIKPILKKIEILNISDIGLNGDIGTELFKHLNPQIRCLNLSLNNLSDSVLSLHNFSSLEVLDISSNRITSDGLNNFLLNLNCIQFKEINLSDNGFLEKFQDGWINFCTALSYMEDLSSLRVGNIGLSCMQIELLLRIFSKKTVPIVFLDISYSAVNEYTAPLLIEALQNTPTLAGLCLDGIKYIPEVENYLKTRVDIKVEWERSGDEAEVESENETLIL